MKKTPISIKLVADSGGVTKELTSVRRNFQQLKAEIEKDAASARSLKKEFAALSKQQAAAARLSAARSRLGVKAHKDIAAEIFGMRRAYVELRKSGKLSMAELAQAKVALNRKIAGLRAQTNGWKKALAGARMELAEIAVIGVGFIKAYQASVKFESAMVNVRKTVGGTDAEIEELGNKLRNLSMKIPVDAGGLAEIAATAGQLGIASGDIVKFTELTAKMSTAFDMTADEAAQSIGKIRNIFNLNIEGVEAFGDAVNRLGNTTSARESEIVEVMTRIGGASQQFGLATEEAAALSAAMIGLTKSPEVAATAINALLMKLQTAESGTEDFKAALAQVGYSAVDMANMVKKSPQEAINNLLGSLKDLDGMERAQILTKLFGAEHQDEIASLVGGLESYNAALGQVANKAALAGSMTEEFGAKAGSSESRLMILKNTALDIWTSLGDGIKPLINLFVELGIAVLKPIAAFTRSMKEIVAYTGVVTALSFSAKSLASVFAIGQMAVSKFGLAGSATVVRLAELGGKVKFLTGLMGRLNPVMAAALLGWDIGQVLNRFDVVKRAGVALMSTLHKGFLRVKQGWAWLTGGDTAAIEQHIAQVDATYAQMFADIGREQKQSAQSRAQTEAGLTGKIKAEASKREGVEKQALNKMKTAYQQYADQVIAAQDKITSRTATLTEKIREMKREEMSDKQAWEDRKAEAEEYYAKAEAAQAAGQQALQAGDRAMANLKFAEAEKAAAKASAAYESLHRDVEDGGKVIATSAENMKVAVDGMQKAAEVANAANKAQIESATAAMEKLTEKANFADLSKGMDAARLAWFESWRAMTVKAGEEVATVEREISAMVDKERVVTIKVREVVEQADKSDTKTPKFHSGGIVHALMNGGHLAGYGGGDRIHALVEAGEFVLRKEAVRKIGLGMLNRLNNLQLPKFQTGGLVLPEIPRFRDGGEVHQPPSAEPVKTVEIKLGTARLRAPESEAQAFIRELERAALLA